MPVSTKPIWEMRPFNRIPQDKVLAAVYAFGAVVSVPVGNYHYAVVLSLMAAMELDDGRISDSRIGVFIYFICAVLLFIDIGSGAFPQVADSVGVPSMFR